MKLIDKIFYIDKKRKRQNPALGMAYIILVLCIDCYPLVFFDFPFSYEWDDIKRWLALLLLMTFWSLILLKLIMCFLHDIKKSSK